MHVVLFPVTDHMHTVGPVGLFELFDILDPSANGSSALVSSFSQVGGEGETDKNPS
jgi:hypothetical protein